MPELPYHCPNEKNGAATSRVVAGRGLKPLTAVMYCGHVDGRRGFDHVVVALLNARRTL